MKKWIGFLLGLICVASMGACTMGFGAQGSQGEQSAQSSAHEHTLKRVSARDATCVKEGNITYWTCECGEYFSDSKGENAIAQADTVVAPVAHTLKKTDGLEATCTSKGKREYWSCLVCTKLFADEACTEELLKTQISLGYADHDLTHHELVPVDGRENGVKEHWTCGYCNGYFADEEGSEKITEADTVLYSVLNIPDFIVEVPEGRDPVVLQLSDTQIIDAGQTRPGRDGVNFSFWATDQVEERCYDYLTEIITATKPDFIILTGDIIYGEFDDNGTALTSFVNFMETFQIPWSPVFGNHDNESKKGVDWQCEQFENAKYCLFEQKELSGNGNYSVGIVQGGAIKRVFYMLDSNACGHASAESLANGHTFSSFAGFKPDQIDWYTKQITTLKEYVPEVKISFAYHIQQSVFGEAYAKYGFDQANKNQGEDGLGINLDRMEGVAEGDFGYIGRQMKGPWDGDKSVFNGMKALGVDSIFVGHEHCNNASVVYEGIRFQYGQKSSEYDRFNCINENGFITGADVKTGTSLIGGSVIVLSETDASIKDAYVYYCDDEGEVIENGKINWEAFKD